MEIKVFVSKSYRDFVRPISSTIEQLLEVAGWRSVFVDDPSYADIIYCSNSSLSNIDCASIESWRDMHNSYLVHFNDLYLPNLSIVKRDLSKQVDFVYVAYYFLTGSFEDNLELHQNSFVPIFDSLICKSINKPIVEICINRLRKFLIDKRVSSPAPRWPIGKKWALCISHDCDRIKKFRTFSHFRDSFAHIKRKKLVSSIKSFSYANISLLANFSGIKDPYTESWSNWIKFQNLNNIKSTFFLCTWNRFDKNSSILDVDYNCFDKSLYLLIRDLHENGFDVGLHTSINAWDHRRYDVEVEKFEKAYGFEPQGYRGHYWSMSLNNANDSMKLASETTNMVYSSCLGMNLHTGYRRGICYPYRHFDKINGEYAGNWEVPPIMMDQSLLFSINKNYQIKQTLQAEIHNIKAFNGCFVLDWHSDSLTKGYMNNITESLLGEIEKLASDSECWIANMSEIVNWSKDGRWKANIK
jgi:hypothetical protein